jgi:hypothetical protein
MILPPPSPAATLQALPRLSELVLADVDLRNVGTVQVPRSVTLESSAPTIRPGKVERP